MTANAFLADYRNRAVSGMGVSSGWVDVKANEVWNKRYPYRDSPLDDLSAWTPQLIFINFGENDDSFTRAYNIPFPVDFAENYIGLIRSIRAAWPLAQIVLLRGGMSGGAQSVPLAEAWARVVDTAESTDSKVSHLVFQHWTAAHPRVSDDSVLAKELVDWLQQQPFMQPYR